MQDRYFLDLIKQVDIAAKSLMMYSETHPSAQTALQNAYRMLNQAVEERSPFTISVIGEGLLLEGKPVEGKGGPVIDRFVQLLSDLNIHSITFNQGLKQPELVSLLRVLNLKPKRIEDMGGLDVVLDKDAIKSIQVNKIKYGVIGEDGIEDYSDELILSQLATALQSAMTGEGGGGSGIGTGTGSGGDTGSGVSAAAIAEKVEGSLENLPSREPAELLFSMFHQIMQSAPAGPIEDQILKERFLEVFRSFTPRMQGRLLLGAVLNKSILEKSSLKGFYRQLSPDEMESSILNLLDEVQETSKLDKFFSVLQKEEKVLLSDLVRKKMDEMGLLKREPGVTLTSWEDLTKRDSLDPMDIERVPEALSHMLMEAEMTEADQLFKRVLGYLSNGRPEQKIATVKAIPAMVTALSRNVRWVNVEASLSLLVANYYRKESDPDVLSALMFYLLSSFQHNFEAGNFPACQSLLATIRSRANNMENFEDLVSQYINSMAVPFNFAMREGTEGAETALDYLQLCGPAGAELFLELLAEEEDQHVRARLITFIEKLERVDLLPAMEKRLSDPRWYVVRNMVTIIGKMIDLKETPAFLQQAARHRDPRVAKELIKKLLKTITSTDAPIVLQLLQHHDKTIRTQAVHLTAKLNAPTAIPILLRLVNTESKEDTDLRALTYQALLKMRATEAVPPAMLLLDSSGGRADVIERSYAVKVLGELARAESRSILQKIASSDPSPEVRSLATTYL